MRICNDYKEFFANKTKLQNCVTTDNPTKQPAYRKINKASVSLELLIYFLRIYCTDIPCEKLLPIPWRPVKNFF